MQDQLYNQAARQMGYCGRFKAWQMALMFMGFVFILAGGLPMLCHLVGLL